MIPRDNFFDVLKGVAIIAVVLIHVGSSVMPKLDIHSWNFIFLCVLRQVMAFAVPLFIFIAGYWNAKYEFKTRDEWMSFYSKRLIRVVGPYVFWSGLFIILAEGGVHLKSTVIDLLMGRTSVYYFVVLLLQFYILTPVFKLINRDWKAGFLLCGLLNSVTLLGLYILRLVLHVELPFSYYATPFFMWIVFYELGLFIGSNVERVILFLKSYKQWIFAGLFCALFLSLVEAFVLVPISKSFAFSTVRFTGFLYSVAVILVFFVARSYFEKFPRVFLILGKMSFGIYLIHMFIQRWVIMIIPEVIFKIQPFYQIVVTAIVIMISIVTIKLFLRLLPNTINKFLLGFTD